MKNFKDALGVFFSLLVALFLGVVVILCYVYLVLGFGVFGLLIASFAALIPAFFCYGITSAAVDFIRRRWGNNRK